METFIWFSVPGAVLLCAIVITHPALIQSEGNKVLGAVAVPTLGFGVHQFYRLVFEILGGFEGKWRTALNRIQSEFAPNSGIEDCKRRKAFLIWETTFYGDKFPSAFRDHNRGAWRYILSFQSTVFAAALALGWTVLWYCLGGRQQHLGATVALEVLVGLVFALKAEYTRKSIVRQEYAATFAWCRLFAKTCEMLQKMP